MAGGGKGAWMVLGVSPRVRGMLGGVVLWGIERRGLKGLGLG